MTTKRAAFIDTFTKKVVGYNLEKTCSASDLKLALKSALNSLTLDEKKNLIIRSDNGPQMSSHQFKACVDSQEMTHELTPIKCPDKNAFAESFFSILEIEFLQVRYFLSMKEVHRQVREWLNWYNTRRFHESLKYNSPDMFIKKIKAGLEYEYTV